MATFANTFEGGTNGSTITVGNSGGTSGDAFTGTSVPANSTVTYATASAFHGTLGMRVETTATNVSAYVQQDVTAANRNVLRFYFKIDTVPTAVCTIAHVRNPAAAAAQIAIDATGHLYVGSTSGTLITGTTSSSALVATTWYRLELGVTPGTTTTSGVVDFAYYAGDSTTAIFNVTVSGANLGSAQTTRYRLGRPSPNTPIAVAHFDDVKVSDLASGYLGPEVIYPNYEKVWDGSTWVQCPESERVWDGSAWS